MYNASSYSTLFRLLLLVFLASTLTACNSTAVPAAPTAVPAVPTAVPAAPTAVPAAPTAVPAVLPAWVPEMVEVPAGSFLMGSSVTDLDAPSNEQPQHTLTLPTYWIGKTEVTNAQFRLFVTGDGYTNRAYWDENGWQWRLDQKIDKPLCWDKAKYAELGDNYPVVCVSWFEAMAYTRWLSVQTGLIFSLPTEAEWEKAARGSDGRIYPWGNTWDTKRTNGYETGFLKSTVVGQYPSGSSPYGALDMAGNVWEWTASIYADYPYNSSDGREDIRHVSWRAKERLVLRGGSWNNSPRLLRSATRGSDYPGDFTAYILQAGFRIVQHIQ